MFSRNLGFIRQSRTHLYLVIAAVVLFLVIFTRTSRPVPGRLLTHLASSRPVTGAVGSSESNARDVKADKPSRRQRSVFGNQGSQIRDPSKTSTVTADRVLSTHTSGSQVPQSLEQDNVLVNSLPVSNTAKGHVALDSIPVVKHREAVSAAAAHQNALLERSAHGQRHQEQSSKLGTDQPHVPVSLQPDVTLSNVTNKSNPQPLAAPQPVVKPQPADRDNLIIVMPSSIDRMPIVTASRGWRQGVRTYIAFEDEVDLKNVSSIFREGVTHHNEVYGVCPDQYVSDPKWHKAGDLRATVTPFLANMTIGPDNFKWMLFGDDDTVFLIDNVLNLLPHLDPKVPYFMTDHLWYPDTVDGKQLYTHANRWAPRCLPCNYTDPAEHGFRNMSAQYPVPRGCPCNTNALCKADKAGKFGADCSWDTNSPGYWYFGHGGAGMLMSSALFRQASYDDVVEWIWSLGDISSGDSMLMGAMHVVLGVIPTDPGYGYFRPHIRCFDPGWHGLQVKGAEDENTGDNGNDPLGVLARLKLASAGKCDAQCEDQLQHTISVHLRTRYLASELNEDEVSANLLDYVGSPDHKPAAYLHHSFQMLWTQYNNARSNRSWFDVQLPNLS